MPEDETMAVGGDAEVDQSGFGLAASIDDLTEEFVAASRRSLDWFGKPLEVGNKSASGFDPVTEADRHVEDLIRSVILDRFPDHTVVGEERGHKQGSNQEVEWIVDPIDGTRAFITGRPMWGTLVGVRVSGVPVAGWMHVPVLDHTYVGFAGRATFADSSQSGATSDMSELSTRPTQSLAEAVLFSTHPSMFVGTDTTAFDRLEKSVRLSRFDGDCVNYGLLAAGFGDLVVENQLQPYDIVPLVPIIEGAGGVVTDIDGGQVGSGWAVAAATQELHAEALAILRGSPVS